MVYVDLAWKKVIIFWVTIVVTSLQLFRLEDVNF